MKLIPIFLAIGWIIPCPAHSQISTFEKTSGKETATYHEIVAWYRQADENSEAIKVIESGTTDAGYPLQLVLVSADGNFDTASWKENHKIILFINNGIHPGEPDGIDACMLLVRDIATKKFQLPANVVLGIIPVYNIGGCLNRNSTSRVNQDGPVSYGFRGNSQNLDLNRDFTKCDSRESMTFSRLFHFLSPHIFLDTHVSDGADYQHTMTLLTTQYNKLGTVLGNWLRDEFEPGIYKAMSVKKWDMIPYVDFEFSDPDKGMTMFYDPPRYSSGYAALFGCISFISETHMLKPYQQRVKSTYDLITTLIEKSQFHATEIWNKRKAVLADALKQTRFPLSWEPVKNVHSEILFKGYEQDSSVSDATGLTRIFFNRKKPFEKKIKFYHEFKGVREVNKPIAYLLPRGWHEVADRLRLNNVRLDSLPDDTVLQVRTYRIEQYQSRAYPYEKHHKNHDVNVSSSLQKVSFLKGDYIIYCNQPVNRYIIEMLEPNGDDGFFAWNFFDAVLQQKEGYSDYRWEDVATAYLRTNPELQKQLAEKKAADPAFAKDAQKILAFIYQHSPYYEKEHLRYPCFRLEG